MSESAETCVARLIELFDKYRECFGLSDADWPLYNILDRQVEYEDKFCAIICDHRGHDIGPDQCGKPEHDLCYRCHRLKTDIEKKP